MEGYTVCMNRTLLGTSGLLCTLIIMSASFAYAQNTAPAASTSEEVVPPDVTPAKRTFTAEPTLRKVAQTRLLNLAANMSNRMEGVVKRLQNVADRLASRLTKMEAQGNDVTSARAELALAQQKINEANQNLTTIDTEVNAFIGSATPRENWQNLKTTYLHTRTAIIAAHQSILATINLAQNAALPSIKSPTTASSTNI